jgi:hypothetical protein
MEICQEEWIGSFGAASTSESRLVVVYGIFRFQPLTLRNWSSYVYGTNVAGVSKIRLAVVHSPTANLSQQINGALDTETTT